MLQPFCLARGDYLAGEDRVLKLDAAIGKIRGQGYKATPQRIAVLQALAEEPLLDLGELRRRCPEVGSVTVYRAVALLRELGIARRVDFGDGPRYEMDEDHRHRLICGLCGGVLDLEEQGQDLERRLLQTIGFEAKICRIEVYSRCHERCASRG